MSSPTAQRPWTPTPSAELAEEIRQALTRPRASWVAPPRPVVHTGRQRVTGWLWGRLKTPADDWLGLATLYEGTCFQGAELHWYPVDELRTLDEETRR